MSERESKIDPTSKIIIPAEAEAPNNGKDPKAELPQIPQIVVNPQLRRFERYFDKPVAVQLRRPLVLFDYSGENMRMMSEGNSLSEYGLCAPAMMLGEDGKPEPVGSVTVLPRVVLVPYGGELLAWIISPATGAMIEVSIPPENIEYVTFVARLPSRLVTPNSAS